VARISEAVIGPHKLFDMTSHSALPAARHGRERTEAWHRDIDVFHDSPANVRYLWFFLYLDDFTAANGSTWIVPGSQRIPNDRLPSETKGAERFPAKVQLLGSAGDLVIINPSALHTVGHNSTDRPRRMMNISVCHVDVRPLVDHWAIAGPAIQPRAGERLRRMLGAEPAWSLDTTWSLLPDGWQTAERLPVDPAARVFPREQQGFQRSHRIR
jgi:ectoine hydroxylase-related dioxygenase (phytanoyl-CoA dioxygenase family)